MASHFRPGTVTNSQEPETLSCRGPSPDIDLHDLIEGDAILAPVVQLGGAGGGVCRHLPRLLQRAAVLEVGGDAGGSKRVAADGG